MVATPMFQIFRGGDTAYAAQITDRSITLEANATALAAELPTASAPSITGHADSTGLADHHFTITVPSFATMNSIGVEYCTTATGTCTAPTDLTIATGDGASLGTTVDLSGTPTYASTAANAGYVDATLDNSTVEFTIDDAYNPSDENTTFYVRITAYTSIDATTGATDTGTVAASTTRTIIVTGVMPEYLLFCTGSTVNAACDTIGTGAISFDQEFNPTDTAVTTSQMAASTNAASGYAIVVAGTTLTSGSNTVAQQGGTSVDAITGQGTSTWGINLMLNDGTGATHVVASSADVTPASDGATSDLWADPTAQYKIEGAYALDLTTPDTIAESDFGDPGNSHATFAQVYTVSYFANVSAIQPAGTYTATLNYVCTPTF